jgi:hypothetical protein
MSVGVHKGVIYAFRSFLYGRDIDIAAAVERLSRHVPRGEPTILLTGTVRRDLAGTAWDERLEPLDSGGNLLEAARSLRGTQYADVEVYRVRGSAVAPARSKTSGGAPASPAP